MLDHARVRDAVEALAASGRYLELAPDLEDPELNSLSTGAFGLSERHLVTGWNQGEHGPW